MGRGFPGVLLAVYGIRKICLEMSSEVVAFYCGNLSDLGISLGSLEIRMGDVCI